MIYNLKELIKKYNKILSERYGIDFDLLKDFRDSKDSLDTLKSECWSDVCDTWLECDYILKYLYFRYIKNDIKDFEKIEGEENE